MTLERNYRSTQPILARPNAVIELAQERYTKNLWSDESPPSVRVWSASRDEADQARYVVEKVLEGARAGHGAQVAGGAVSRRAP